MARTCTICGHGDRAAIDEGLTASTPYRDIAAQHGVSLSALTRHREAHLSPALKALAAERAQAGAASALDRFEDLYREASVILQALKADGNSTKALAAVQVLAGVLEKIARVTGELDDRPTVQVLNVQASADWIALRQAILGALASHPEARAAVLQALSSAGDTKAVDHA